MTSRQAFPLVALSSGYGPGLGEGCDDSQCDARVILGVPLTPSTPLWVGGQRA